MELEEFKSDNLPENIVSLGFPRLVYFMGDIIDFGITSGLEARVDVIRLKALKNSIGYVAGEIGFGGVVPNSHGRGVYHCAVQYYRRK